MWEKMYEYSLQYREWYKLTHIIHGFYMLIPVCLSLFIIPQINIWSHSFSHW